MEILTHDKFTIHGSEIDLQVVFCGNSERHYKLQKLLATM